MQQAGIEISSDKPWLAPLAGWSDLPFRLLCRELGAAVCCTEMLSAKGLVYKGRNTSELLASSPDDLPLVAQIFGSEPEFMAKATVILRAQGFEYFDINMGCSVPKVTKTGSGASLLKNPGLALEVADAVISNCPPGRVGCKLRLGWDTGQSIFLRMGEKLAALGAAWLTLHPRYARQGFSGSADWSALKELRSVPVALIASGDLFFAADGLRCLQETGVDAVMYARGALRDPTIFWQHHILLGNPVRNLGGSSLGSTDLPPQLKKSPQFLAAVIMRHAWLAKQHSPQRALLKMRTLIPQYVKNLDGARVLRQKLIACADWADFDSLVLDFLGPQSERIDPSLPLKEYGVLHEPV